MIKWIKNTYYMSLNKWYTFRIHSADIDLFTGDITPYYHKLITKKYKTKIMDNLNKIIL